MSIAILGQSEPPGRRPPDTRTLRRSSTALLRFSFSVQFRRLFPPLSRSPKPSASASRLPNTGTSLATLLSFANAVVTRRRVQVYTLPLSAPGSLSAPWPPSILRQAPIAVEHSRLFERRLTPGYPRNLFNPGPAAISALAFTRLSFAVALPSRDSQAYTMGLFTPVTPV